VQVTLFPAAKKSVMIFAFDHIVCDYPTAYNFMYLWFEEAAAAAAAAACLAATGSAVNADSLKISIVSSADALISIGSEMQGTLAAEPLLHCSSMAGHCCSPGVGLGAAAGSLEIFSRRCYEECEHWQLPPSPHTSIDGSTGKTQQQNQLPQDQLCVAAQQWLDRHSGANCPFPVSCFQSAGSHLDNAVLAARLMRKWLQHTTKPSVAVAPHADPCPWFHCCLSAVCLPGSGIP